MARILLIDDEEALRHTLREPLVGDGHYVVEAEHGRAGLACLRHQPIDLIVTDMLMPEMEGVETIRAIRRLHPAMKIIAICDDPAGRGYLYLDMAQKLGAGKVLIKPFRPAQLLAAVRELLNQGEGTERS